MQLRDYLKKNRIRIGIFADQIEYNRSTLYCIMEGKVKPGRKFINRVERATGNAVTGEDLLNKYKENNKEIIIRK